MNPLTIFGQSIGHLDLPGNSMMVDADKMELVTINPENNSVLYHFKVVDRGFFTAPHPGITLKQEARVMELLGEIMEDEGVM